MLNASPVRTRAGDGNFASGSLLIRLAILCAVFFGFLLQGTTTIVARPLPTGYSTLASASAEPTPPSAPEVGQPAPSTATPTATATATILPTVVATELPTPSENALTTAVPFPAITLTTTTAIESGVFLQAIEILWATDQTCNFPIVEPANSIDLAFNDLIAACTGPFAGADQSWTYTAFQDTSFTTVAQALLEIRFYMTGWVNDGVDLELYNGSWNQVARFDPANDTPPGTLTTLIYNVSSLLQASAQVNGVQLRFRGVSAAGPADDINIYLDEARLIIDDVLPTSTPLLPIPTPTAPAPAPTNVPSANDPHVDYGATTASCAGCHRTHTGSGLVLRRDWPEENICFSCHASTGPGTDVQLAFTGNTNTDTAFFKHDVALTNGVHRIGQSAGLDFGGSNRHVECEDCHEPHEASRGPAEAPMLPHEMTYVSGVDPVWAAVGAPAAFNWLPQAEREYQVCFKCHSSFTSLPAYLPDGWDGDSFVANGLSKLTSSDPLQVPDSRDLAQEFNPYNASFHPVAAPGRNQSIPPESFVAGWSQTSLVYCRDCHTNPDGATQGDGPHGSARLHLLAGQADYTTVYGSNNRMSDQELCFNCHNYETYVAGQNNYTNFYAHSNHLNRNWGVTCYTCHDSHGSEQLHLLNFDTAAVTFLNGRNSQSAWYVDPTGQAGCYLTCHNRQHDNLTYWTNVANSTLGYAQEITLTLKSSSEIYLPIILK